MRNFFKMFFASLLALIAFFLFLFFLVAGLIALVGDGEKKAIGPHAVLVLDLSKKFREIGDKNPLAILDDESELESPTTYDLVRMIGKASGDTAVKGIYIKCGNNANGVGTSQEIRDALAAFRKSNKFIIAYADVIEQNAYLVASVSSKVYCNPKGGLDWRGYSMTYFFIKGALDRLGIEPQIFYAGKFKSATEPFRETKMTEPNRVQSTALLEDMYSHFLQLTATARKIDTATLRRYAEENTIRTAADAWKAGLLDGLRYDDEVKAEIRERIGLGKNARINFVTPGQYHRSMDDGKMSKDKVAVIYAQGDIIDGKGNEDNIASEDYRNLIRKVREDKSVKAVVFRINSGGGSAMASENIWRELTLTRKEKPVVVSFGDVAASGGYYVSCNADSIFAQPNTITGSIGVFSILPNMQRFFNEKLGVTFDGVRTGPYADVNITRPLTPAQKAWLQSGVDSIYRTFTGRVAEGRHKDQAYIDSIGQGRVWTGIRAVQLGLVDRLGGLNDAIASAAHMAKLKDYRLREFPEPAGIFEKYFKAIEDNVSEAVISRELGAEELQWYRSVKNIRSYFGIPQARMPFDLQVQ